MADEKLVLMARPRVVPSVLAAARKRAGGMSDSRLINTALREYAAGDRWRAEHRMAVVDAMAHKLSEMRWEALGCHFVLVMDARKAAGRPVMNFSELFQPPDHTTAFIDRVQAMLEVLGIDYGDSKPWLPAEAEATS